jgi:hypothetical protein
VARRRAAAIERRRLAKDEKHVYARVSTSMNSPRHCRQHAFAQRHCRQHAFAQRHCRQHALTAALPPACTHCGIAASMHSSRHCRQHALTAALPPACTHCGIAASMHSPRHCRQHAHTAALPPATSYVFHMCIHTKAISAQVVAWIATGIGVCRKPWLKQMARSM